jgi:hypothetical protein
MSDIDDPAEHQLLRRCVVVVKAGGQDVAGVPTSDGAGASCKEQTENIEEGTPSAALRRQLSVTFSGDHTAGGPN